MLLGTTRTPVRRLAAPFVAAITLLLPLLPASARARTWSAMPIEVHEWGVQVFDLSGSGTGEPLPAHIHTPVDAPGAPVTHWSPPVRDLPEDTGDRAKPILYFRLPGEPAGYDGVVPVSVEVGFAWGDATAWYPQADHACVPSAPVPERDVLLRWIASLANDRFEKREEATARLSACGRTIRHVLEAAQTHDDPEVRSRIAALLASYAGPQLRWDHLLMRHSAPVFGRPEGASATPSLPGEDLPEDHWVKVARRVDAAYIGNGLEAEKYLFYEGRTAERPAVTAEALSEGRPERGPYRLTNRSAYPVHDLFLGDPVAVGFTYVEILNPGESVEVRMEPWGKRPSPGEKLLERLATQPTADRGPGGALRDPAQPQGPTTQAWLHPDEARALLGIWGRDFFEGEGIRTVYREDPAALDEAMPLRIYTDMHHAIDLSRVGLVLVKGIGTPGGGVGGTRR
ncbi:MAG: hypothetical protein HY608_08145 [Planctomycetes bacterium]|nr:hypothetical protein [Planctomycetota bacterium]